MAAKQFGLPANMAFNTNGLAVPGATASLYTTGTLTPAVFYSNSGLTVSLGSTITANGVGRFPRAYQDNATPFRLIVKDASGATLDGGDIDPYYFGVTAGLDGTPASVTIGTVTTGVAGSSAAASNSGTSQNVVLDLTIPTGATGPAGDVAAATSRTALAAIAGPAAGATRYLRESGREGSFVFDSSNLSTMVTADPNQALYVAPSSDTTGASGAWVRKFNGPAISTWWGLSTSNTAAQNGAAMDAAMVTLKALRISTGGLGYGWDTYGLHTPLGVYNIDRTIAPQAGLTFTGDSGMMGGGTVFVFSADVRGMYLQGWDGSDRHAAGYRVRGIHLKGNGSTSGGNAGIEANSIGVVSDCLIENFSGDGIYAWGATGTPAGNANGAVFQNIYIQTCRNGTYTDNSDGNAISFINVSVSSCRLSGHFDSSFLGCYYSYGTLQTCGLTTGFATRCVYSGNVYSVKQGQEVGASTNAPSGTTAHNTWWQYMRAGTVAAYQPAWTSGLTWYFSAPFCNDNDNQTSTFMSIYIEQDGNPCWLRGSAYVSPGFIAVPVYSILDGLPYGGWMTGASTLMRFHRTLSSDGGLIVAGTAGGSTQNTYLGPQSNPGFSSDYDVQIHNWNANSQLSFYSQGVLKGYVLVAAGNSYYNGGAHNFRSLAGTAWATFDSSGLAVKIGTIGYAAGSGGTVAQATSRTTGVTLNKGTGQITLVSAAGSASWQTFTVTNSTVAATDTIRVCQSSGTDLNMIHVTNVAAGSFKISFATTGGTTTEQPVFNFAVIKGANS